MAALLEQSPVRFSTLLNLTRGAVGAHLHPADGLGAMLDGERLRASTSAVLAAAMVLIAVATALCAIALQIDASRLAASPNGPLAAPRRTSPWRSRWW